jgi:ATP-dependent DNA ligase
VFYAFGLLISTARTSWRRPLMDTRATLRRLIEEHPRPPIQFSDHADCDGLLFFKAAVKLGLEGKFSKPGYQLSIAVVPRSTGLRSRI